MDNVRIGIVGIGNIGSFHATYLSQGRIAGATLAAVCDLRAERLAWARATLGEGFAVFGDYGAMLAAGGLDAVLIAVPHYLHPPFAVQAFARGLHVLCEKPAGVYARQVREMDAAAAASGRVYAMMFNQRTTPAVNKVKDLLDAGELGALKRVAYTMTAMYRTQAYYDSGGWRGTWSGEGGGVLMNQAPHNLDIWLRLCGLPARVRGFCFEGKNRTLECEDEATAYLEYPGGAIGVGFFSTSEPVPVNRLELVGTRGRIVLEDEATLTFQRVPVDERDFNAAAREGFAKQDAWTCAIPVGKLDNYQQGHMLVTRNFVDAVLRGAPLIAPGPEGIRVTQLIDAIYLSSWLDRVVAFPVDEGLYYDALQERIRTSSFTKPPVVERTFDDMARSF